MANNIALAEKYLPLLDEKYKKESVTSILDAPEELVMQTQQAKTVLIPKMLLQGLGDYDRNNGYVDGDVTLEWESHTFTQDRGRSFSIDNYDNIETMGVAYGKLAGEFIRVHVAPEIDTYRLNTYYNNAGTTVTGTLTENDILLAIDTGVEVLDDAEAPEEDRVLFVSSEVYKLMKNSPTISRRITVDESNKGVINRKIEKFDELILRKVPKTRFNTLITLNDGTTAGQEVGGYITSGQDINFMIVSKSAVAQITKTALPRIFDPTVNQLANAWKFDYRIYHDAFVMDNKVDGIYAHAKSV